LITSQWCSSSSTAIIKEAGFGGVGMRRKNPSPLEKAATKIRGENARGLDFAFCLFSLHKSRHILFQPSR
jgi:hypothetical protein